MMKKLLDISITPGAVSMRFGQRLQFSATVTNASDASVDYVDDYNSLRFGSRTLAGFGGSGAISAARVRGVVRSAAASSDGGFGS